MIEDIITRSRGRLKNEYTEEEIEALKQKKEILLKDIAKIILKKKTSKAEWTKNNRPLVNERARIYRAKKEPEK